MQAQNLKAPAYQVGRDMNEDMPPVQAEALQAYLARCVGGTELVLIERCGEGRTEGYARVELCGSDATPGEIVPVHISAASQQRLKGHVAA